jgi:hypothetical protein
LYTHTLLLLSTSEEATHGSLSAVFWELTLNHTEGMLLDWSLLGLSLIT